MAVYVNNPPVGYTDRPSSGLGFFLGMILLVVVLLALLYYGLPALRGGFGGGPSVNVPGKIDVNVTQPGQ
jgi:hypothetical protein